MPEAKKAKKAEMQPAVDQNLLDSVKDLKIDDLWDTMHYSQSKRTLNWEPVEHLILNSKNNEESQKETGRIQNCDVIYMDDGEERKINVVFQGDLAIKLLYANNKDYFNEDPEISKDAVCKVPLSGVPPVFNQSNKKNIWITLN